MKSVTMHCQDLSVADVEFTLPGMKVDPGVRLPEGAAPAVVVAADHKHRKSSGEVNDLSRHPGGVSRDHPTVAEPEVVDVAGQEQRVAHGWNRVEKGEERLLVRSRCRAQMGIGYHDETLSNHGGKGGA